MIEYRKWITREMMRAEPDRLFVFGDNLAGYGWGGQALEMRGEPNAVGIPTKRLPSMQPRAFLSDQDLAEWRGAACAAFERLRGWQDGIVWPSDGIGTGRAELPTRAPAIWAELEAFRLSLHGRFVRSDYRIAEA